uniref:Transposase n=1 Tax=Ditylenchus dipsaci TaxID=166011 RepID=A0A915E849_9BILA
MNARSRRSTIVELHSRGKQVSAIANELGIDKSAVSKAVPRYRELGTLEDRHRSGRVATANKPVVQKKLKQKIGQNPQRSKRKMTKQLGISKRSVRRIVKQKLGMHSYKLQEVHLLTDALKTPGTRNAKLCSEGSVVIDTSQFFFRIRSSFTVGQQFNKQNTQILASSSSSKRYGCAGITANGKTSLVFIDQGVKINQQIYWNQILEAVVEPWANEHFREQQWTFQQDSTPAHKAKTTQQWCKDHSPDGRIHYLISTRWTI